MSEPVSEHPLINHKYGIRSPVKIPDLELELYAFRNRLQPNEGGLGTFNHFVNVSKMVWPKMSWNPWLEAQVESLCEHDYVGWAGCGASGKTFGATLFATVWWLANPSKTTVVLTSTTAKMIRKRMWANLQELVRKSRGFPGNMVDSKMSLQAIKGDDRHSISAIAVAEGNTSKAVANIQGIHAERVMVIIDEATDTPEAAFEACTNLSKGCREFKMLVIGNPASKYDPHGRFCTPAKGWRSVTIEDQHWLTERGMCRRFDGMKSPNISEGRTKYPYLITHDQVLSAMRHEGEQSPTFWKYTRGFWSPDGMVKTVLSESIIETYTPTRKLVFTTNVQVVAGLDPGFGGDRCVLRFAKVGTANDKVSILFGDVIHISPNAQLTEPVHYQIANRVKEECSQRGVPPDKFALDSSGEGGGLADILTREWGVVHRVEFGGSASTIPVSDEDSRPCNEAYDRKVTELWFSMRKWVVEERVGGMDIETLQEFCARMFDDSKRKISVETKTVMKQRTGKSPDLADAAVVLLDLVRKTAVLEPRATKVDKVWEKLVREADSIYHDEQIEG
ncbi:MAG: hypothetical protein WCK04_00850 [Actinomycetes bacterium]